ncbi:MAG: hypothetical protein L3J56_04275 [Bacteroidales bacterium]|nr:hypothetical protein [Bacteroidales bacterium]
MENQDLLTYVAIIIALTAIFLQISKHFNFKKLQKDTKKLQEEYKNNLEKIEKEFAKKRAELENTVREYDERFAAIHQVLFDIQYLVIKNPNVIISDAERETAEEDLKKFGDMIK